MNDVTPAIRRLRRVAPLALVLVLASACGDDDKPTATPTQPPSATTGPATTTGSSETLPMPTVPSGKSGRKGMLRTDKRDILPLLGGSISRFAPTQVEGKSLQVVALAGPDSFWAGRSRGQRILVKMRLKGGSPPQIVVGQKVEFIGGLTAFPGDAGALGVENESDKTLLERQGAYVDASALDVKLG